MSPSFNFSSPLPPHRQFFAVLGCPTGLLRGDYTQLLWLEMALFSKEALYNIEKHS